MRGGGIKNFDYSEECTNFAEKDITNNKEDMKRFLTKVWGILAMLTLLTTGSEAMTRTTGENALAMKTDERIQIPLIGNVSGRQGMTLNGDWQYIVDVQEEGYYDYRMKENRWGFFLNAKPQRPEDLIEYDFDKSETMRVPLEHARPAPLLLRRLRMAETRLPLRKANREACPSALRCREL